MLVLVLFYANPGYVDAQSQGSAFKENFYENGELQAQWFQGEKRGTYKLVTYYENGAVMSKGLYRDDELIGNSTEYYENGNVYKEITFIEDDLIEVKILYLNGEVKEIGEYLNDRLEGRFSSFYENGQLHEMSFYRSGKAEGLTSEYYNNGQLKLEINYSDGYPDGAVREYFENGQLKSVTLYRDHRKEGESKIYDESGNLLSRQFFVRGKLHGDIKSYFQNGRLSSFAQFKEDVPDGEHRQFDERGVLRFWNTYKEGVVVKERAYTAKGKRIKDDSLAGGGLKFKSFDEVHIYQSIIVFFGALYFFMAWLLFIYKRKNKETSSEDKLASHSQGLLDTMEFNQLFPDTKKLYRQTLENVSCGIFVVNKSGLIIYANYTFAKICGFKHKQEMFGRDITKDFQDARGGQNNFLTQLKESKGKALYRMHLLLPDGRTTILSVAGNYIYDDAGSPIACEGVVNDVTMQSRLEDAVELEKRKLELILEFCEKIDMVRDMAVLGDFIIDGICNILEVQRCSLLLEEAGSGMLKIMAAKGIPEDVMVNHKVKIGEAIAGSVAEKVEPLFIKDIEGDDRFSNERIGEYFGRSFMCLPFRLNNHSVGVICVTDKESSEVFSAPFTEIDFKILHIMVGRISIAIDNVSLFNELNLLTVTDPMTQISNYRLFSQILDQELRRQKREHRNLCLSMIDIDYFKNYNDTFGHLGGDNLLRKLGELLKAHLRDTDIVCRYAGDEFCVVFVDTDLEGARLACEKIRGVVGNYAFQARVTLSIGIAKYQKGMTKKEFIQQADKALYRAKEEGRNRVVL